MDEGQSREPVTLSRSQVQGELELLDKPVLGFFKIEYTGNALLYMHERRISKHHVLTTLRAPDEMGLPTAEGRERVRRNQNAREAIDVVYDVLEDRVRVITVFKTKRPLVRRRRR